ncbi:uncharacterized protein H6S33_004422 [Morchella sextelata]|uniref:uncharacterized protein n=1 Tax=Morchella sextelata TaxID=1174677 RepID=UPI001D057C7C|nr:uncharacterized protein H6S33_004422 [Morchella sextelata]KAH0605965.1 hypothetical protein H6S33_004422 [Morchella sextelata]
MDVPTILTPPTPTRSSSPDPARQLSRSPRPYRRTTLPSSTPRPSAASSSRRATYLPSPLPTPDISRAPSPLPGARRRRKERLSAGGSESGTEADDELTKRLPAPPGKRKRTLSEEDTYYGEVEEEADDLDGRGRRRKRRVDEENGERRRKRKRIVFVRRGIEVALMGMLAGVVVYDGGRGKVWKEILAWKIVFVSILALFPLQILLRSLPFELPQSLDPAPLLYPILFPILVSLSLTEVGAPGRNQYILANIILSLSSIPPSFLSFPDLHWVLSLVPLVLRQHLSSEFTPSDTYPFLPPLQHTLVAVLNNLLEPSLTQTEIRLISVALINLLLYASTPQAIILKSILWGGGLATLVSCSDIIKFNIDLARVPTNRLFRRAGNTVITIARLRKLASALRPKGQASDSETEIEPLLIPKVPGRPRAKSRSNVSYYATLTPSQYRLRKWGYPLFVYTSIFATVMLGLRPYIALHALDGLDPFLWAPSYLLCGQPFYQSFVDTFSPGTGYCVTTGSAAAANLRLSIIALWALIIAIGITLVTALSPYVQVDTRRKVFHGMVVVMFLIPGVLDPQFTHLCLSLALGAFIILDIVRAGQLPPASRFIARFLQPFVDGRDLKGPVVVSHVFLLLGCGAGWWLTLAATPEGDPWDWSNRTTSLAFVSGVVSVGLGDAAASLIGRRFGRTKWGWRGGKSIEGSLAFMTVVAAGIAVGRWWIGAGTSGCGRCGPLQLQWEWEVCAKIVAVGAWGSMVEAVVTGVNDNVVVPVGAWILVIGLGI